MPVKLMQFSAILLMTLLALKLFMLPRKSKSNPVVQTTRWLLTASILLLGIHFLLQYYFEFRTQNVRMAIILNLAFFIPCSALFSLGVLNLLRRGRLTNFEKYISIPIWIVVMTMIYFDKSPLVDVEIACSALYAAMQLYYSYHQMRRMRHIRDVLSDYYDFEMDYVLRWMQWSFFLLTLMAVMVPFIIFGKGPLLALFSMIFFFGIFYLIDSFCLFFVSNAAAEVEEAETETEQHDTGVRMSGNAMRRVDAAISRWLDSQGHLEAGLNMPSAAAKMGVPRYLLSAWFKQRGLHYSDWLAGLRIDEAKRMIREHPDWSNETIARHCGFSDRTYFQRKFKEITGMTPNEFMNSAV